MRAMVMIHTQYTCKGQGKRSLCSKVTVEKDGRRDRQTDVIARPPEQLVTMIRLAYALHLLDQPMDTACSTELYSLSAETANSLSPAQTCNTDAPNTNTKRSTNMCRIYCKKNPYDAQYLLTMALLKNFLMQPITFYCQHSVSARYPCLAVMQTCSSYYSKAETTVHVCVCANTSAAMINCPLHQKCEWRKGQHSTLDDCIRQINIHDLYCVLILYQGMCLIQS